MVKISEIRNIVAGADWYPPPVSLRVLGYIDNISPTSTVPLSAWAGEIGAGYKSIGLSSPQDTPTGIEWESGYSEIERYVDITANCLWRIDFDGSNLGPIQVADISGFPFEGNGMADKYGGNGFIVLHGGGDAPQAFSGHIRIEYNTNFGRTHVDIPLYDSGDPSVDFAPLFVDPPMIERSGLHHTVTVTIYNVFGGSVNVDSSSLWIEGFQFSQIDANTYDCTFNLDQYTNLCHNQREGGVMFSDGWDRMASLKVIQNPSKHELPVVHDPMGVSYPYVQIGDYYVMIENLRTEIFADYTQIDDVTGASAWGNAAYPAFCAYNNDTGFVNNYGYLYNGWTARKEFDYGGLIDQYDQPYPNDLTDDRNWHIPSQSEWNDIIGATGVSDETRSLAMRCNREVPSSHPRWNEGVGGNNASDFSAFGQGVREANGNFWGLGFVSSFWTSTEHPNLFNENFVMCIPTAFQSQTTFWFQRNPDSWHLPKMNSGNAIRLVRRI